MRVKGSLPELVRKGVERDLGRYCEGRIPPHVREQIRMEYEIRGNSVTLIERRPPWRPEQTSEWSRLTVVIESVKPARPFKARATHLFERHELGTTLYTSSMEIIPTGAGATWRESRPPPPQQNNRLCPTPRR